MLETSRADVIVTGTGAGVPERVIRAAVQLVLRRERRPARIGVIFLSKRGMRQLNAEYLRHDTPTDVIAFPLPQPDGSLAGDVFICAFMAAANARAHREPVRDEIVRLVIHGTLHVLGWNHPAGADRMNSPMWRRQEQYVAAAT
jgi:probable rRNA maturation factor